MKRHTPTAPPPGARTPRTGRPARSGDPAPAESPDAPEPSGPDDVGPDRAPAPDAVRVDEQAPDPGAAGEQSVREAAEDDWLDAERVGPRSDAP